MIDPLDRAILCGGPPTDTDVDTVIAFAAFLQSIPEVTAGRACWTDLGLDYAGLTELDR